MKTKVIFRKFQGEILALFPAEAATVGNTDHCSSYAHMGQHAAADVDGVIRASKPARPEEYAPLATELSRIGYALDIRKRQTRKDYLTRKAQLAR